MKEERKERGVAHRVDPGRMIVKRSRGEEECRPGGRGGWEITTGQDLRKVV